MASKKQLKQYIKNLEAILFLNYPEDKEGELTLLTSKNTSIETKIACSNDKLFKDFTTFSSKVPMLHLRRRFSNKSVDI